MVIKFHDALLRNCWTGSLPIRISKVPQPVADENGRVSQFIITADAIITGDCAAVIRAESTGAVGSVVSSTGSASKMGGNRPISTAHPSIVMLKHEDWRGQQKITDLRDDETNGCRRVSIPCGYGGGFLTEDLRRVVSRSCL